MCWAGRRWACQLINIYSTRHSPSQPPALTDWACVRYQLTIQPPVCLCMALSLSQSVSVSVCVSLCRTHTHTHTQTYRCTDCWWSVVSGQCVSLCLSVRSSVCLSLVVPVILVYVVAAPHCSATLYSALLCSAVSRAAFNAITGRSVSQSVARSDHGPLD